MASKAGPRRAGRGDPVLAVLSMPLRLLLAAGGLAVSHLTREQELRLGPKLGRLAFRLGLFRRGISHIVIEPELASGRALEDPVNATQVLASKVEEWVRRHPEQWLWIHRRFKNVAWPAEG